MYNFPQIDEFLESWKRTDHFKMDYTIIRSEMEKNGRICSEVDTLSGPILAKNDMNFLATLELGVAVLIEILIHDFGLITIGSCEGHKNLSTEHNISKRFAMLIWRNREEYKKIYPILKKVADRVNTGFQNVKLAFFDFEEEFPNKEMYHLCFMVFIPFNNNVDVYFEEVEKIYQAFIQALMIEKHEISIPSDY